jgi:alpha-tubulin suppressor-like RCC1 family protein
MLRSLLVLASLVVATAVAAPAGAQQPEAALVGVRSVEVGGYHSCAILTNREVRCWGYNDDGELGNGTYQGPATVAVATRNASNTGRLQNVTQLALGLYHSCALLTTGQVRCWGYNNDGQLGTGDNDRSNRPRVVRNPQDTGALQGVVAISAEHNGTCALLGNGQVRCWGDDSSGQLGNGLPLADSSLPVRVKAVSGSGALTGIVGIDGGWGSTCAATGGGQARCWGAQGDGVLGNGGATGTSPLPVVVRNAQNGATLTGVRQVTISGSHACASLRDGRARCWGDNGWGELGTGGTNDNTRAVLVRRRDGAALTGIAAVDVSFNSSCARMSNGQVRCWGRDPLGENGDGTIASPDYRKVPNLVHNTNNDPGALTGVTQLAGGNLHYCVRVGSGRARCWGDGGDGQLGNGDTDAVPFPVPVQGLPEL